MLRNSPIPLWVNIFMFIILLFMIPQVYLFFFNHDFLREAGISIAGDPDLNIIYTTASRLLAMVAVTVFVLITQNPFQYLVVLIMSALREGQEMFIDPLFPYANAPGSPAIDFGMHVIIVAIEIFACITVYKAAKRQAATENDSSGS